MTTWNPQANELFLKALELRSAGERQKFLDEACAGDKGLRAEVESLIQANDKAGGFLETPVRSPIGTVDEQPVNGCPGTVIGPYKLLQQIGEGGMGVVYMAEQEQPVRRKVALKIIKAGMDSKQVIARFEAERQALAMMDHGNIARVFDGGTTGGESGGIGEPGRVSAGRPYFVMELIHGVPITTYCDDNRLTPRERLELFVPVCQAIQHAHQKGIIHRDIKPSNVMVTLYDGQPVPKVIDFGVAKATEQKLTERTLFTQYGSVVGTLEYMSPEQAETSALGVDTRSDIYSLGVLLYELVTGSTPFTRKRLQDASYAEILRMIKEEEPPRPSTRLSDSGETLATISAQRHMEPAKLTKLVRGELDWIVMKTLEKDRNRRYETASGLAHDVERYLKDEPVLACPPSAGYRLGKFVRRHKPELAIAGLVLFMLVFLGGAVGWIASQQNVRRNQLDRDLTAMLDEAQSKQAEIHAQLADPIRVCQLLSKIDGWHETLAKARGAWQHAHSLAASNPDVLTAALAERLRQVDEDLQADEADWKVAQKLDDIRLEHATLTDGKWDWNAPGPKYEKFFGNMGLDWKTTKPTEIASQLQQARLRYVLVAAMDDWAVHTKDKPMVLLLLETARLADPDPWRDQVRDPKTNPQALAKLVQEADVARQSPHHLLLLAGRLKKADKAALLRSALVHYPQDLWLHWSLGFVLENADQRIGCFQAALALRPTSGPARNNLGVALAAKKDFDGALVQFRKALELNPSLVEAYSNLGDALQKLQKLPEAEAAYRKAIQLQPNDAEAYSNLGNALYAQQKLPEAEAAYRKAIQLQPNDAKPYYNLGSALRAQQKLPEAEAAYRKAIELKPDYAEAYTNLGVALHAQQKLPEAIAAFRKALAIKPDFAEAYIAYNGLGGALRDQQKLPEAEAAYREAIALQPNDATLHSNLGAALSAQQKLPEAEAAYRKAIALKPDYAEAYYNLGTVLINQQKLSEAEAAYRKALEVKPKFAEAYIAYGNALLDQQKLTEAVTAYRKAIALQPDFAIAYYNLGNALNVQGKPDEAIACYRKATQLKDDYADAHWGLGGVLRDEGQFADSLAFLKRAHDLGSRSPEWSYPSAREVRQGEQFILLDAKLPMILKGEILPADAAERVTLAHLSQLKCRQFFAASARFYGEAFAAEPKLANDLDTGNRYDAACAAALAGCGHGKDAAQLEANEYARLRGQALAWLRADLTAWRLMLEKDPDKARPAVRDRMQHLQRDPDFNGVRGAAALAKLPEAERLEWRQLWGEVAALRGAFVGQSDNGNLSRSTGLAWGPDGNLYVGSIGTNQVLRFDGTTGAFLGAFIEGVDTPAVQGLVFRPDGLYVLSRNAATVQRFDATTGALLGTFIPAGSGGLSAAKGMTVGPDGNWYVSSGTDEILRYGATGAFLGAFVPAGSGGLKTPRGLTFGPDGNLYVCSASSHAILRYNGQTGAFLDAFVAFDSSGLYYPGEARFSGGSLYVSTHGGGVLRYDAQTGAFIDRVAPIWPVPTEGPIGLLFDSNNNLLAGSKTEILRYGESSPSTASAVGARALHLLKQHKYTDAEPLLRESLKFREQKEPDDWRTFHTKSMLGGSLLGQKKYAEAEPLLLAGYEGMKQRQEKMLPREMIRLTEAVERLVQLYEATGQPAKAAEWRKRLEPAKAPPQP